MLWYQSQPSGLLLLRLLRPPPISKGKQTGLILNSIEQTPFRRNQAIKEYIYDEDKDFLG